MLTNQTIPVSIALTWAILVMVAASPDRALAQHPPPSPDTSRSPSVWLGVGFGPGYPYLGTYGVSLNAGRGRVYQIAFNNNTELTLFGGTPSTVYSVGVSIGRDVYDNRATGVRIVVLAGPAFIWGRKPYDPVLGREPYVSTGLALNMQVISEMGIGFDLYANFNGVQSVAGLRLAVQIGAY